MNFTLFITLLACLVGFSEAQSLTNPTSNIPSSANLQNNIPSANGESSGLFGGLMNSVSGLFQPLVDIGTSRVSPQGRHVGVNVPLFYHLEVDTRGVPGQAKVSSNTLMGLVRVERDRVRGPDGKLHGPVEVSIMGIPVYKNNEPAPAPGTQAGPLLPNLNGMTNNLSNMQLTNPTQGGSTNTPRIN